MVPALDKLPEEKQTFTYFVMYSTVVIEGKGKDTNSALVNQLAKFFCLKISVILFSSFCVTYCYKHFLLCIVAQNWEIHSTVPSFEIFVFKYFVRKFPIYQLL